MSANDLDLPETYSLSFHGDVESHPYIKNIPYRRLGNTSLRVSQVSFGAAALGNCDGIDPELYGAGNFGNFYKQVSLKDGIEAVHEGIKSGINYIDTSPWYGASETVLGIALKDIPRNTYYIGTKAGRNFTPTEEGRFDFSASAVLKSFERSLTRLGLPDVDIIQVHDIEFCPDVNIIVNETLPALESIVRAGKAKYIGITGYDIKVLKEVASRAHVDTVLSYCRYNLNDLSLLDFLPFFKEKNVGIINASALSMGLLSNDGPPDWHPATPEIKNAARKAVTLAKDHGTTLEDVSLGFSLRPKEPEIATTLVGMSTKAVLHHNLSVVTKPRTSVDEEMYKEFRALFNNSNCHWEGVEISRLEK